MTTEIRVPTLGESVTEATIGQWFKAEGEAVKADEPVVELETDKVTLEVPSPVSGVLKEIRVRPGETVEVGAVLGLIEEGAAAADAGGGKSGTREAGAEAAGEGASADAAVESRKMGAKQAPEPPATEGKGTSAGSVTRESETETDSARATALSRRLSPAVRRLVAEKNVDITKVRGTGKGGRILKEDVLRHLAEAARPQPAPTEVISARAPVPPEDAAREERVKMSRLRLTIARRLKEAQNTAAMLTTFNEVDMSEVIALRNAYKELFQKKHGVKLGFMSFFVRAVTHALKEIPILNAEVDGDEIVYKNYYHIGVAVGTERGLVVPVVREADTLSLAEIEKRIADFAARARAGRLKIEEMQGGTFTITNGGVYGSLMSTPILNMPQSGILGMHRIQQRPVVMPDGAIVARPMMYLALTYDHRIVDGREAVTFLVRVKEFLEDPKRLILDL
jgi:2-oxoglutarate dehydrogenase E2 component (dihydrolipoamide succinyltransferase)